MQWIDAITLINFATIRCHSYWEINHQRKHLKHCEYVEEKKEQWHFEYEDGKKSIMLWVCTKKKGVDEVKTIIFFFLLMGACELAPKSVLLLMDAKIAIIKHSYVTQLQNKGLILSSSP